MNTLDKFKSSKLLIYILIYTFFVLLSGLNEGSRLMMIGLISLSPLLLKTDTDRLSFLIYSACFMRCFINISTFSVVMTVALFIWCLEIIIPNIKLKNKSQNIVSLVVAAFYLIAFIYSFIYNKGHIYKFIQFTSLILSILTFYLIKNNLDLKKIAYTLFGGIVLSSLISLLFFWGVIIRTPFWGANRFRACFTYVNTLGVYCIMCQTGLFVLFSNKQIKANIFLVMSAILMWIGLLTYSKTFVILLIITILTEFALSIIKFKNKKKTLLILSIIAVLLGLAVIIFKDYINALIARFDIAGGKFDLNAFTTGRVDVWKPYIKAWTKNAWTILFGNGFTTKAIFIESRYFSAHCTILALLYQLGIIGTIGFICLIALCTKQGSKLSKNICNYLPLLIILINSLVEELYNVLHCSLPIVIALIFIISTHNDHKIENDNEIKSNIDK